MQYAILQDRILAAEEYISLMTHRTGIIQLEIPDIGMSLKLVYGSLKPQPDSSAEDVMAETLRTLGARYGTIADRECIPSELVDIEFGEPLIRGKAVDVPFAALLRIAMEIGAKRKTSTPLFVLYGDMNPAESLLNRPGVLCVYRQENRPRAEITEFGWRDAFRPERPLQCARNCL